MNLYSHYTDALEKVAKNVPTSPEKWARAKSAAKAKFDVYPSAYANGWAAKKYKSMGGGWKKEAGAESDFPANDYGKAAAMQAIRGKSPAEKKRERRGIALSVGIPLAMVAGGVLYDRMKKKAELDKEAYVSAILGAGRALYTGAKALMASKKAKTALKVAGGISDAATGVSAIKSVASPRPKPVPAPPSTV